MSPLKKRSLNGFFRSQHLGGDEPFDDFNEGDIALSKAGTIVGGVDERGAALIQLTDAAGNQVDENRRMRNYFRRFVDEITFHISGNRGKTLRSTGFRSRKRTEVGSHGRGTG